MIQCWFVGSISLSLPPRQKKIHRPKIGNRTISLSYAFYSVFLIFFFVIRLFTLFHLPCLHMYLSVAYMHTRTRFYLLFCSFDHFICVDLFKLYHSDLFCLYVRICYYCFAVCSFLSVIPFISFIHSFI